MKSYLVHVPYLFWGFWKIIYPFIDPTVKEKVISPYADKTSETFLLPYPEVVSKSSPEYSSGKLLGRLCQFVQMYRKFYSIILHFIIFFVFQIEFVEDKLLKSTLSKDIDESQLPDIFGGDLPLVPIK